MIKADYELIKKHVTLTDAVPTQRGPGSPLMHLEVPMSGEIEYDSWKGPNTVRVHCGELDLEFGDDYQLNGACYLEISYEYMVFEGVTDSVYCCAQMRDTVMQNLIRAGFSSEAARDIEQVDVEMHGTIYYKAPGLAKEIIEAHYEKATVWTLKYGTALL